MRQEDCITLKKHREPPGRDLIEAARAIVACVRLHALHHRTEELAR